MKQKRLYIDYLIDIYEQTVNIKEFIRNVTFDEYESDYKLYYATCTALEFISEATKKLPKEIYDKHPEVKWQEIVNWRDLLKDYQVLEQYDIWKICKTNIVTLRRCIKSIIKESLKLIDDRELLEILNATIKTIEEDLKLYDF